jgi:hypothetical protein
MQLYPPKRWILTNVASAHLQPRVSYPALHPGVRVVLLLLLGKGTNATWMGVSRREPKDLLGSYLDFRFLHRMLRCWCDLVELD